MKTRLGRTGLAVLVAVCVAFPVAALARSKNKVLESIKDRYPALVELLGEKKVGETFRGLIEVVNSRYLQSKVEAKGKTITVEQFIQDENDDRMEYFEIAAKETNTTREVVAKNFAAHRKLKLKKGEYWKGENGQWVETK